MNTKAVVITEPGKVALQNVALRNPSAKDVIIETEYTSISAGTERMLLQGQMPHPMLQLPVVPGYETVGRVVEVGAAVSSDLLDQYVYLGGAHCFDGINPAWGGQSATLFAPAERVVPLGAVKPRNGVILALAATALHGLERLELLGNERILVLGQGTVGQLAARIAAEQGAWVTATDKNGRRLKKSVAHRRIDVSRHKLADSVEPNLDIIIDATGSMAALAEAVPLLAQGGTILLLGFYHKIDLPYAPLFMKEARLLTAKEWGAGDLGHCRDLIETGRLEVDSLLTHELPIEHVTQAYETALNDAECLKLVLDWRA